MMVSIDYTYQWFYPKRLSLLYTGDVSLSQNKLLFEKYYSFGLNFDYKLSKFIGFQLGYSYETINYTSGLNDRTMLLNGSGISLNLFLNVWNSKPIKFEPKQISAYVYGGIRFTKYVYNIRTAPPYLRKEIEGFEIIDNTKESYNLGLSLNYKIDQKKFVFWEGFMSYHDNYGIIVYSNDRGTYFLTRLINFIMSYGTRLGFGYYF